MWRLTMKLDHEKQLTKLIDTIKKTQKFVNTFTDTIIIDKETEKETTNIKKLKNNNQDEFV